ncbi:MAG TPA: DUF3857 domain-containing protein [Candidatus Omnitrophica bacterium]|nr:MAG: hypothetical protein DRP61_00480 [Candidatus Omnitrophota bacterium]HEC70121.1 DUF3857 domain-containing protein [Candidatus Omnitrophota bacterium]
MRKIFLLVVSLFILGCSPGDSLERASQNIDILSKRIEDSYKKLLEKHPEDVRIRLSFAKFYYQRNEFSKVKDILKGVNNFEGKLLLAKSYAQEGNYTSSLEIFEEFEEENLKDPQALYLYALSCEKKNLFSKAKKLYQKITPSPYLKLAQKRLSELKLKFQDELPSSLREIVENSPTSLDFPDASSVILFCKEKIKITPENKQETTLHLMVKVLNDKGRQNWGEVEINYDSTYERVELDFARTITPDKKIIYVGKENIRDVSKYLNFPLYSNLRAFIVSMPEVLRGSIIECKVKIYGSKLLNKKDFSIIYKLAEEEPIVKAEFILSFPLGRKINWGVLNKEYLPSHISFEPRKVIKEGFLNYIFEFKNIPQLIPESDMVPYSFVNPAGVFSSFSNWEEFYNWWKALYEDKLALNKEMKDFLKDLIKTADSDYEKAKRIYEFCAEKIRYVAVEYGKAGFEPHRAREVFINKYGDCKDQAVLLVALLRASGLKAYPVLIPTKSAYNLKESLPASYFNHAIACVKIGEDLIFMDPTSSTTSFGDLPPSDQNRKVLIFFEDDYKICSTPLLKDNFLRIKMNISIDKEETAKIKREVASKGFFSSSRKYYLKNTPPQLIRDNIQEKIKKFASLSELLEFNIKNAESLSEGEPLLEYEFLAYNLLSKVKELRILPFLGEEVFEPSWINREKRLYPLYLGSPYKVEIEAEIHLPPNLELEYLPQDLEVNSELLNFSLSYKKISGSIIFKELLSVEKEIIYPSEYSEFKKIVEAALYNLKQQIILRKKDEKIQED